MMNRQIKITLSLVLTSLMLLTISSCSSAATSPQQQVERIQGKAKAAKQGVIDWKRSGKDPSKMLKLMSQVKPAMDNKDFNKAESMLDEVLEMLKQGDGAATASRTVPAGESVTEEFGAPEKVNIVDYSEDTMEPFISRDGKYLFFNNLNDPHINTNLYYAERIDALNFKFKGEVKGVNSKALDAVPTMDEHNNFCFVSTREFSSTKITLFCGSFDNGEVSNVHPIGDTLKEKEGLWLNMGPELSPDGNTLYYTESNLDPKTGIPKVLDIVFAVRKNSAFYRADSSDEIMKNINTDELEYAPSISNDGRELFFTRAGQLIVGNQSVGSDLRIYMAKRNNPGEPFGKPGLIGSIAGFVEGPTVTGDGKSLYYHKKEGSRFHIFRVTRK